MLVKGGTEMQTDNGPFMALIFVHKCPHKVSVHMLILQMIE